MTVPTPFPALPALPADPGEYLTNFQGHIAKFAIDKFGKLQLTITVDDVDKYMAMPLTDIRGRSFRFATYAERGRTPIVASGVAAVYQGRERVAGRRMDRRWARVRRDHFEGSFD